MSAVYPETHSKKKEERWTDGWIEAWKMGRDVIKQE